MLQHLHIRDFIIVRELDLELQAGMTVLTGETGAGKSILIDALGLTLGERADTGVIRQGAERAEVSASFEVSKHPEARDWLEANDLAVDECECVLRRVIPRQGRSRAFINGSPAPLQQLVAIGNLLVDVHGQHEHQSLLRPLAQLALLDGFARAGALANEVRTLHQRWRETRAKLDELRSASRDSLDRMDLLRFQVEELAAAAPADNELAQLDDEHARLANAERLLASCHTIVDLLSEGEEHSARSLIERGVGELEGILDFDQRLGEPLDVLREAAIQVREASDELRRYASAVELDPQRLQAVEERLGVIHDLARKHRIEPAELPSRLRALQQELADFDQVDDRLKELEDSLRQIESAYRDGAGQLNERRRKGATTLSREVSKAMQGLAMEGGRFSVDLTTDTDATPSPQGFDHATFLVSANPGQALQPLSRVASGGELSRIALAIQVIAADSAPVPTLIFDEVDSGIGGGTAEIVGRSLQNLGKSRQVLCVTHLPQVAARADSQLGVEKRSTADTTVASIQSMEGEKRVEELARMLGGVEITANTLAHAQEMIEQARND